MRFLSTWGLTRATSPFSRPPPSPLPCLPLKPLARLFKTEALSLASEVTHRHRGRRPYPIIMSIILVNELGKISSHQKSISVPICYRPNMKFTSFTFTTRQVALVVQRLPGSCMESRPHRYFNLVLNPTFHRY